MTASTNKDTNSQNSMVVYAGNRRWGLFGWISAIISAGIIGVFLTLHSTKDSLPIKLSEVISSTYGWAIFFGIPLLIVVLRIFTVFFPPRAFRLWFDRTEIGKEGRKIARNWHRYAKRVSRNVTDINLQGSKSYPGLKSAYKQDNKLILRLFYPEQRPETGYWTYQNEIAQAFLERYGFTSVSVFPGWGSKFGKGFTLEIIPSDVTQGVRTWGSN